MNYTESATVNGIRVELEYTAEELYTQYLEKKEEGEGQSGRKKAKAPLDRRRFRYPYVSTAGQRYVVENLHLTSIEVQAVHGGEYAALMLEDDGGVKAGSLIYGGIALDALGLWGYVPGGEQMATTLAVGGLQSGKVIPSQYLGLVDKYDQVVATNKGSRVSITVGGEPVPFLRGTPEFFSANGVYAVANMELTTEPGASVEMTCTAEPAAVAPAAGESGIVEYGVRWSLGIRPCEAGEE
jgi:hypothetical protein